MRKEKNALIIYTIIILFFIIANCSFVHAADLSELIWGENSGAWSLVNAGNFIVGIIKWAGEAILIGAIILKGIKFVSVSPEGQAQIKKELVMLAIGAVLLYIFTDILNIIYEAVKDAELQ